MRVLFISDVYFPRVNGVSTSIRTFRADLSAAGVETTLVAPDYPQSASPASDPNVVRVASSGVPRDPEDRRMRWKALRAALEPLSAQQVMREAIVRSALDSAARAAFGKADWPRPAATPQSASGSAAGFETRAGAGARFSPAGAAGLPALLAKSAPRQRPRRDRSG